MFSANCLSMILGVKQRIIGTKASTWISILRRKGMTKAGFMLLRRPIVQIANSLISNTSSFRATNRACKFSAWARWASKRSSRDARTQYRMSGSAARKTENNSGFSPFSHLQRQPWWAYRCWRSNRLYLPGSVMPTTSSLLRTSATTCTAVWLTTWPLIRWMEGVRSREQVRAASIRISLCSLFRKWSAQWRTNWVRECPGPKQAENNSAE